MGIVTFLFRTIVWPIKFFWMTAVILAVILHGAGIVDMTVVIDNAITHILGEIYAALPDWMKWVLV